MSAPATIPPHVLQLQRKASDPRQSVWVSANAGSGKTHVLVQRVLRHLLAGVPPAKILCLTFTKAAAANMATKVFAKLAKWTELDDAQLAAEIAAMGCGPVKPEQLIFARRLFARTVETPGGLKIHTIHAFCERLLHLFPFEANVPGRFEVLDDLGQIELLAAAKRAALQKAETDRDRLGAALRRVVAETSQDDFDQLLNEALREREAFRRLSADRDGLTALRLLLGLAPGETVASIEAEMIDGGLAPERWPAIAEALARGTKTDRDKADLFRRAIAACGHLRRAQGSERQAHHAECLAAFLEIFFTQTGEPRRRLLTKTLADERPDLAEDLALEQGRLERLQVRRKAAACLERSAALASLIGEVLTQYDAAKAARGKLDFDDLIARTRALLQRSDARWVLYKLDSGIDHILVDEAQDTSEAQWKILEALSAEFSAGLGARAMHRTFFAVGDEKQSIFSFQGAAPHMFHKMRECFAARFAATGAFEAIQLKDSFRSVPAVLDFVDAVFDWPEHQNGLVSDDIWMGHEALKRDLPGLVEIWPLIRAEPQDEPRDWRLPLDMLDAADPANRLAQRIAQKIAELIAPGSGARVYDGEQQGFRPAHAGDIMILVRTRGPIFEAVIRALKTHKIPVAGADRLQLTEHIAVMDLIAAGQVALLPQDDLALACILKSPLLGFDDDDLLKLAPERHGSLFEALAQSLEDKHRAAHQIILRWKSRAALPPFGFYARLLSEDGGRRAIEGRLGPEAGDALDEFLRLALQAERDGIFSLSRFLADLDGADIEIKRDMEASGDCVRVMTVHAAKGLESKIVFLPDSCGAPRPQHDAKIFCLEDAAGVRLPVWSPRKDHDPEAVTARRQAARVGAEEEYRRLLYVALTRAEERLYIAGFYNVNEPPPTAWANMIDAVLDGSFEAVPAFWNSAETLRRRESRGSFVGDEAQRSIGPPPAETIMPDFLLRTAASEAAPLPPLKPSTALAAADAGADSGAGLRAAALARGRLMHVLLQYLPQLPPAQRRPAALAFLESRGNPIDPAAEELIDQALAVLEADDMQPLFAAGARAEVAVAGRITLPDGTGREVSGQIDRIAETAETVIIADYKTGAVPAPDAVPPRYLAQMALYRAALAPLWPNKSLHVLLIFTAGPKVIELAGEQLDQALAGLCKNGAGGGGGAPA